MYHACRLQCSGQPDCDSHSDTSNSSWVSHIMASGGATSVQLYWDADPQQDEAGGGGAVYHVAFRNAEDLALDITPQEFIFEDSTLVSLINKSLNYWFM